MDVIFGQIQALAVTSRNQILMLEVFILICGVVFSVILTRSITAPVAVALTISKQVTEGNLAVKAQVTGKDELGQLVASLQSMSERLHGVVFSVRRGADNIAVATSEIANGNLDLSARTEEQTGALEETAASIEQLTATVRANSENAQRADKLVKLLIVDSVEKVGAGSGLVERAGTTMVEIVESVERANSLMGDISSASREQADGIHQLNQAVVQMDSVTQQNAALVEEAAAAAKSLEDQAEELKRAMSYFILESGGISNLPVLNVS
jgi:methyl-accepting chemotaxis protein